MDTTGARVYLACRSQQRATQAASEIISQTGASASQVPIISLDLASLQSVRECAMEFMQSQKFCSKEFMQSQKFCVEASPV